MISKDIIRDIIIENQRFTSSIKVQRRDIAMEDTLNYVIVGLRRAGKSYMLYQQIQDLIGDGHSIDEILYFNFEDDRLGELEQSDLDRIKTTYEEMFDCRPLFFLDEIQIVKGWEKFARRLADQHYRVYITGSNAQMLSSEIATILGGRYMVKNVFPFSFREYLTAMGVDLQNRNATSRYKIEIQRHFETFFRFGGLPEITQVQDKRSWLSNLFNKIFFGDILARYAIRNDYAMRFLVRKLAESLKQPSSYNRLAHIVSTEGRKISVDTVIDYIQYMCESWLILPVEDISGKLARRNTNRKYYFIDNGILNLFLFDPNSSLLENLVATTLYRQYSNNVYYYKNGVEVDFYVPENGIAIQVSYSIADVETRRREVEALRKAAAHIEIKDMFIITKDEEELIRDGDSLIKVMPVWKWLLTMNDNLQY